VHSEETQGQGTQSACSTDRGEESEHYTVWGALPGNMLSIVTGYIWGERDVREEKEEEGEEEGEWVIVAEPMKEEILYPSSVSHSVHCSPSNGVSSVSHTAVQHHQGTQSLASHCLPLVTRTATISTQTYSPRAAALLSWGSCTNITNEPKPVNTKASQSTPELRQEAFQTTPDPQLTIESLQLIPEAPQLKLEDPRPTPEAPQLTPETLQSTPESPQLPENIPPFMSPSWSPMLSLQCEAQPLAITYKDTCLSY